MKALPSLHLFPPADRAEEVGEVPPHPLLVVLQLQPRRRSQPRRKKRRRSRTRIWALVFSTKLAIAQDPVSDRSVQATEKALRQENSVSNTDSRDIWWRYRKIQPALLRSKYNLILNESNEMRRDVNENL